MIAAALFTFTAVTQVAPSPASAVTNENCIAKVTGKHADGTFILGRQTCYATYAEVLRHAGASNFSASTTPATVTRSTLLSGSILGTHFDGAGWTGASFSVQGTTCGGGGLNLPSTWNDRISSTANGCAEIIHYENANYTGAEADIFAPGGDITGYMDNKTSSIKYFG